MVQSVVKKDEERSSEPTTALALPDDASEKSDMSAGDIELLWSFQRYIIYYI